MSQLASVEIDSDSDSDSGSSDHDTHHQSLDEGVHQVRKDITKQLKKIDDDGEQIKRIVARAIVANNADPDVSMNLRTEIVNQISEIHSSTDAVTLNEIIVALWAELHRVSEVVTGETESETDADGSADDEGSESDSSEQATAEDDSGAPQGGVGAMFADGSADDDETSPPETDPAFQ